MFSESLLKLGNIERLDSEILIKLSQNKKGQNIFQVHSFRCLFLQLAAEKKTLCTWNFFGPSYFETALVKISLWIAAGPTAHNANVTTNMKQS